MTKTPLRESLASRGLFGFLLQFVLRMRGLLLLPILTRALTPSELGVVSLGSTLTSGLTPLLLLGMHIGLSLHVVRLQGTAIRPAVLTVLSFSVVFSIAASGLLLALVSTGAFGAAMSPLLPVLVPVGVFAVGLALREVAIVLPQVRQELGLIAWSSVLMDFGGTVVAIVAVLSGFGAYGALLGVGAMSLLGAAILAAHSLRVAEGAWTYEASFLRKSLRTALPVVPLALCLWVIQSSDYFFVSYYRGAASVAIYGLAYSLASPTLMVMAAVNLTYLPTCVEILQQGRKPFAAFMDDSTRFFAILAIVAIAFAAAAGPGLTAWIAGPAYVESGRLLPVLVAAYGFYSLAQLQQFIPGSMTQDMTGSSRAHAWAALINVAANFILVPRFGLWGAAWSTLLAYAVAFHLLTRTALTLLPEQRWTAQALPLFGLLVMSTGLGLLMAGQASGPLSAAFLGAGALIVTLTMAAMLGLLTRDDLKRLAVLARPLVPKL